ncbi:nucleotidyltransferase family protein [Mesorhizobium australicum]|uniref:Nucleotidyltransferase domain-containing protein n=1 Tax=Mesorhizobium australicum TaxID=536018 RepID=A0A1X7P5X4_9HYPH|nr:nucleotidyltransferase domain-containing protein [Mesorhizobium australicum]SMH46265.1 Nucleotidyltransferase domain-containing protein [Mesorhizobium australicum]
MRVTTLTERKAAEAARRKRAADDVVRELDEYARKHGGRFVIFGSYATDTMRFDSDLDVLIDFPADRTADAWRFVEDACARLAVPLDVHDARTTKASFVERVHAQGLVLS